jgi:hypothetical protein
MNGERPETQEAVAWLRIDELENAIDSLETCAYFLEHFPNPYKWKWAILALHQATYGFAICAVKGTADDSVLLPPNRDGVRLISVWEALRRAQNPAYLWATARPLELSPEESAALDRLFDEFRNGFSHFQPGGWSIAVQAIVEVFQPAIAVLSRVALHLGMVRYYEESDTARVEAALVRIGAILVTEISASV